MPEIKESDCMTIDEAIVHAREVAEYNRKCNENSDCIDIECERCAEEHEQLAEWLEELKAYRQYIDLTEIPEQYKLGFQDGIIEGNNKAIDDFVRFANTMPTVEEEDGEIRPMRLEEMTERLKCSEIMKEW